MARGSVPAQLGQPALLLLPKQAADGRLDAFALGAFVQGVLAAVAAAGVAARVLRSAAGGHRGRRGVGGTNVNHSGGPEVRPREELTVSVREGRGEGRDPSRWQGRCGTGLP